MARVIHQIWYNFKEWGMPSVPPEELMAITDQWRKMNPDWHYILWNEANSTQLLATFYPQLLEKFMAFKRPIQRVDFFKWVALYHFGGLFCDFDCVPLRPLSQHPEIYKIAKRDDKLDKHGQEGRMDLLIVPASWWAGNALIFTTPGHPAVNMVIDAMSPLDPWPFRSHNSVIAVFCTTGPWLVNRTLRQCRSQTDLLFDERLLWHVPGGPASTSHAPFFVKHLGHGSWGYGKGLWTDVAQIAWLLIIAILLLLFFAFAICNIFSTKPFATYFQQKEKQATS